MYRHQHERWNHWIIFFFGSIASAFVLRQQAPSNIPLWLIDLFAAGLSVVWVLAASSLRATSGAWRSTIRDIELASPGGSADIQPFERFEQHLAAFGRWRDFGRSLQLLWSAEPYKRLTRLLTVLGVAAVF